MDIQPAVSLMTDYFDDARHVDHTMKVLAEAEAIIDAEPFGGRDGFLVDVIRLACVFHDIGIPNAIRIHGSSAGPHQEREGVPVAAELLDRLNVRADLRERVCFIVGHHHTRDAIDGPDFQVVWDADMIVNLREGNVVPQGPVADFIERSFETAAGAARARQQG